MSFEEALGRFGFERTEERVTGDAVVYRARPNRYLTSTVHAYPDGTALFTWEFAIVDYLATRGVVLGSSEALNTFLYPASDETGPQDAGWLTAVLDRAEATLRSIDLADPER